ALQAARHQGDADLVQALLLLEQETEEGSVVPSDGRPQAGGDAEVGGDGEWTRIFAAGSSAMHLTDAGASEVTVREAIYTPAGLQYLLDHPTATVRWMVGADRLQPIHGVSVFNLYNRMTGERRQAA
ncbi:MAG: hypothetical protein ACO3I0_05325, partial [Limisphaerales bacterium]